MTNYQAVIGRRWLIMTAKGSGWFLILRLDVTLCILKQIGVPS